MDQSIAANSLWKRLDQITKLSKDLRWSMKYLFPMPVQMFIQWQVVARLRSLQR